MRNGPRHCIVHIGPLPPPLGGMAVNVQGFLSSDVGKMCDLVHIRSDLIGKLNAVGLARTLLNGVNCLLLLGFLFLALLRHRPQIVHIRTSSYSGFYEKALLAWFAKMCGRITILHVHGGGFRQFHTESSAVGQRLIVRCLNQCDRVIALSDEMRSSFEAMGVKPEQITVVNNAVEPPEETVLTRSDLGRGSVRILFLNRIDIEKGIYDLLEAMRRAVAVYAEVECVVYGPECPASVAFRREVERLQLDRWVKVRGPVSGREKALAYLQSDIYVLPSHVEAMPMGLLEAMSYGLPCIASDVGAVASVIDHGHSGWVIPPGNADELAKSILLLAKDAAMRRKLGENAVHIIRQRYTWQSRAHQVVELYDRLAASSRAGVR